MQPELDRELDGLPPDQRWREWLRRIEAVLFASAGPVGREALARVVGQGVSVDLLVGDLVEDLASRPYQVVRVAGAWMLRTRPAYAVVIRVAADVGGQSMDLGDFDLAVLTAIALHQPIGREGLREIFGKDIPRAVTRHLSERDLITTGPREPRRGAPFSFVTTEVFLAAFGLNSLRDLPDGDFLGDAGMAEE